MESVYNLYRTLQQTAENKNSIYRIFFSHASLQQLKRVGSVKENCKDAFLRQFVNTEIL